MFPMVMRSNRSVSGLARDKVANKKCHTSIKEKFRSLDVFGEDISLSYRGSSKFKTTPGAAASVLIVSVLTAYALFRFYILANKMYPDISKQT